MSSLARIITIYQASNAAATVELYRQLAEIGPAGELAVNLLRACKKSERAKVYTRRYKGASYDGKQWAMGEICRVLVAHPHIVPAWGWGLDEKQPYHRHVLYVELPNGQVSFHTDERGAGPDYGRPWDGKPGVSAQRACSFAASLLDQRAEAA